MMNSGDRYGHDERLQGFPIMSLSGRGELSAMDPVIGKSQVRSAVRSNGKSGFVFVNNYERMKPLGTNDLEFCGQTIAVPEGSSFVFPFGMTFRTLNVDWATAQPFCTLDNAIYFAAVQGIEARISIGGEVVSPELDEPFEADGVTIVVMSPEKSLNAYKVGDQVLFSDDILYVDGDKVMCESWMDGAELTAIQTRKADPARVPEMVEGLPMLPKCDEMKKAASWTFEVPQLDNPEDWFVAVSYRGDIAQVWADDEMVEDNFWNGRTMYVRVSDLVGKNVSLNILPLPKDFPIYLQKEQREELASCEGDVMCSLDSIRLIHRVRTEFEID